MSIGNNITNCWDVSARSSVTNLKVPSVSCGSQVTAKTLTILLLVIFNSNKPMMQGHLHREAVPCWTDVSYIFFRIKLVSAGCFYVSTAASVHHIL